MSQRIDYYFSFPSPWAYIGHAAFEDVARTYGCAVNYKPVLLGDLFAETGGLPLGKRDLAHNINFFMNVPVTPEGGLKFDDGVSEPGKYVEMRAEMDVWCLISNCPQLNNPCNAYNPTPVEVLLWD